jgi:PadR family transcriptional regulator
MPHEDFLGSFEQLVLLAVLRLQDEAYGMMVRRELEQRVGRSVSLGAVYATLDRLEKKGYVVAHDGDATAARAGRAKRYFRVQPSGLAALRRSLDAIRTMANGLRGLRKPLGGAI